MSVTRRCVLRRSGSSLAGHVVLLPDGMSLPQLADKAASVLGVNAARASFFLPSGGEIDDPDLIRDDDVVLVTEGEPVVLGLSVGGSATGKRRLVHTAVPTPAATPLWPPVPSDWVRLCVGGKEFLITRDSLERVSGNRLARMAAALPPGQQTLFVDRDPGCIGVLLHYLRSGELSLSDDTDFVRLHRDAVYYEFHDLAAALAENIDLDADPSTTSTPITRDEVVRLLISASTSGATRCQGMNFQGADLSCLDLRRANFKLANLAGCNLQDCNLDHCSFEQADLTGANLANTHVKGCNFNRATLTAACFVDADGEDPCLQAFASFEGANLKGADLSRSRFSGASFRVATLKGAVLVDCDVRSANLAGADLREVDFSRSNLTSTVLRGANTVGAKFQKNPMGPHMAPSPDNYIVIPKPH
eukprot:m.71534 g.71534  ORF g.71534 m.71534 type:complete len:418 (+) comp14190_c0_seq1:477-1730(+)